MGLFSDVETKTMTIRVDQKTGSTYGHTWYIYSDEYPDEIFNADTPLIWFKLKIGHTYVVNTAGVRFGSCNEIITEIVREVL